MFYNINYKWKTLILDQIALNRFIVEHNLLYYILINNLETTYIGSCQ